MKSFDKGDKKIHKNRYLPEAQALRDATMAYFIYKNWKEGKVFLHFNGRYHSDNYEGIYWYLKKLNPHLKISTITTVVQDEPATFDKENINRADFIITVTK